MFFKPREQKQKTIESFPTFSSKKKVLLSGYIKKKESKKKKESSKYEAKETRVIQNEKFFKTEKKTKHGKIT